MKKYLTEVWNKIADFFTSKKEVSTVEDVSLPLNLQFFSEPPANPEPEPKPEPTPEPTPEPKPNPEEHMIPKTRFDEVNKRAREAEAALQKIKDAEAERDRQAKLKQGEYETLYQEADGKAKQFEQNYETAKEKAERLEGVVNNMLTTKLEVIPEEFHDLIPENLTPEQKLDWVTKAEAKGLFQDKSQDPVGGATNPGNTPEDLNKLPVNQLFQSGYKN